MQIVYRGFDGFDAAIQGRIPSELVARLEEAQGQARETMSPVLLEWQGACMHVAETGARGGYAFRCDTGPDGATWFFKRPSARDPWGVRVSFKSRALALYGLGGVRARLHGFLDQIGVRTTALSVHIGRVDYAIDFLLPGFQIMPEHFVMRGRSTRHDTFDMEVASSSARCTGVRIGKMPGRQLALYDKRADVIAKRKVEWPVIWNANLRAAGLPEIDIKDRDRSQVWRVELRAGKRHLKDRWGIATWADLDAKAGDVFQRTLTDIRYTCPTPDSNRARWPEHPLWAACRRALDEDLFEMTANADPGVVKQVHREDHAEMLMGQLLGLSATWAALVGFSSDRTEGIPAEIAKQIANAQRRDPERYAQRMGEALKRYAFL